MGREGTDTCQLCRYPFSREGSKDFSRHCHSCGLFRKDVEGFVKSYPANREGAVRWMDNFARRRDLAKGITVNGSRILRKVACSVSDHYSMAAVASTTYFAYNPNRSYVEELLEVKRIVS